MRASLLAALCMLALPLAAARGVHAAEGEIDAAVMQGIKKVGMVSLLPEVLEVSYVGNVVFDNFHYVGPVEWWGVNAYLESALAGQLKQRDRFEWKELSYDRRALIRQATQVPRSSRIETLQPELAKLAAAHGVDALFVVLPGGVKGGLLCGRGCEVGYGNTGFGIYSIGAKIGPLARQRGDSAYVSVAIHVTRADGTVLAENQLAGAVAVPFNRSNEFIGIPAPMLASFEKAIKSLVDRELPDTLARFGLFNAAPPAIATGDVTLMPTLKVDLGCCPLSAAGLDGDITAGYLKAVQAEGLKVGEEIAVLTVRSVHRARKPNVFTPPAGNNRIDALLEFRGNR